MDIILAIVVIWSNKKTFSTVFSFMMKRKSDFKRTIWNLAKPTLYSKFINKLQEENLYT
jgi:hypothetical protein